MSHATRRDFIKTAGSLTIGFCLAGPKTWAANPGPKTGRPPAENLPGDLNDYPRIDSWLEVLDDGRVRILTGKIELGQGIRTAVAQVAAEELDLEMAQVEVLQADTGRTPDEGYTAGSNSIEASAIAIRYAAAAARQKLLDEAAQRLDVPVTTLTLKNGVISTPQHSITISALLHGRQLTDEVKMPVTLKPKDQHQLIGKPVKRPDNIPIIHGSPYYVQDLELPNMIHGRIIRPPSYGATLKSFDKGALPKTIKIISNGSFVGVIAQTEYAAIKAQEALKKNAQWTDGPALPKLDPGQLPDYLRTLPVKTEMVKQTGDVTNLTPPIKATYFKPYIMHGAIGPSCAVAQYDGNKLTIWSHSQGVYPLRETIATMLGIPADHIHIKGTPGSGCYGHNGADDVAADAALLAMACPGNPIHVQWSREDEHAWEPYGSAMLMDLEAALDNTGRITHWKYSLSSDTHGARPGGKAENLLAARYLEKPFKAKPSGYSGGAYRNAEPYYNITNQRITANFFEGPLRASSLRSLGAYANIFAIECFMDELAEKANKDPFTFRFDHLDDPRARQVLETLKKLTANENTGIAFSRYKNSGTYCAVAAKVKVEKTIRVEKLWAVVDAGEVINLDGIKNQIEGGMMQSTSWTLLEQVKFDEKHVTSRQWGTYPVLHINEAPDLNVTIIDRPEERSLGAGEAAQGPTAAAIINAIAKVTGKRIRHLPVATAILESAVP